MNRALLSAIVLTLAWADRDVLPPVTLRILTYNIHHGEGTDGRFDLSRVADVIRSAEPDLVALQEVDQGTERAGGVDQMAELGRLTGMYAEFGRAMDFAGGAYGLGTLSRVPPVAVAIHPLPGLPDREPRTTLTVEVPLGTPGSVLFTNTHLDQGRELGNRVAQAARLNELFVRADGPPLILAGDMNSRPGTEPMQILDSQWINASAGALPSPEAVRGPRVGLDHVMVRPGDGWRIVEARVIDAPIVSDHRPVLVVLER